MFSLEATVVPVVLRSSSPPTMPSKYTNLDITKLSKYIIFSFTSDVVIANLMQNIGDGFWLCRECGYQSNHKANVRMHIDAKHIISVGETCPHCNQHLKNKIALKNHLARKHKNPINFVDC